MSVDINGRMTQSKKRGGPDPPTLRELVAPKGLELTDLS